MGHKLSHERGEDFIPAHLEEPGEHGVEVDSDGKLYIWGCDCGREVDRKQALKIYNKIGRWLMAQNASGT